MQAWAKLSDVISVHIATSQLIKTVEWLRTCGEEGCEGVALWLGSVEEDIASVTTCFIPDQNPIASESGIGYFIPPAALFAMNRYLFESGLRLVAQVHSHPTEAFHSDMDDAHAIVTAEGGFSLVVPFFAQGPVNLKTWAIYRLRDGVWCELGVEDVDSIFKVA